MKYLKNTLIVLLITLFVLELMIFITSNSIFKDKILSKKDYIDEIQRIEGFIFSTEASIASGKPPCENEQVSQHPFLGYVPRPDIEQPCGPGFPSFMCVSKSARPINSLGLYENEFSLEPDVNTIRIGIIGGSVANLLMQSSKHQIESEIRNSGIFPGKKLELLNLAIPGFKQPQQTNLILLLMGMGYKFDAILEISGLNEVYLSRHYNIQTGASYSYPFVYHWTANFPMATSAELQSLLPESWNHNKRKLKRVLSLAPDGILSNSRLVRLVFGSRLKSRFNSLASDVSDIMKSKVSKDSLHKFVYGTELNKKCSTQFCTKERADLWEKSVRSANVILSENNTKYFIMLQPNHYVAKPDEIGLGDREMMSDQFGWDDSDTEAWNTMRKSLFNLSTRGIKTSDLSKPYIFSGNSQVLLDSCCHLNQNGYDILAKNVAKVLIEQWHTK